MKEDLGRSLDKFLNVTECRIIFLVCRMATKSNKWYKRVLLHFTDVALVNSYILKKAVDSDANIKLYQFKLNVAS